MTESKQIKINRELTNIYKRDGMVIPSVVIDEAKDKDSPLHASFVWDNRKAGHQYRLVQARTMIRIAVISVDDEPQKLVHVPATIALEETAHANAANTREGYYKAGPLVAQNPDEFMLALTETRAKLQAAKKAVAYLESCAQKQPTNGDITMKIVAATKAMDVALESLRTIH